MLISIMRKEPKILPNSAGSSRSSSASSLFAVSQLSSTPPVSSSLLIRTRDYNSPSPSPSPDVFLSSRSSPRSSKEPTPVQNNEPTNSSATTNGLTIFSTSPSNPNSAITSPVTGGEIGFEKNTLKIRMNKLFETFTTFLNENQSWFFDDEFIKVKTKFEADQTMLRGFLANDSKLEKALGEFEVAFINLQDTVAKRIQFINTYGRAYLFSLKKQADERSTLSSSQAASPMNATQY